MATSITQLKFYADSLNARGSVSLSMVEGSDYYALPSLDSDLYILRSMCEDNKRVSFEELIDYMRDTCPKDYLLITGLHHSPRYDYVVRAIKTYADKCCDLIFDEYELPKLPIVIDSNGEIVSYTLHISALFIDVLSEKLITIDGSHLGDLEKLSKVLSGNFNISCTQEMITQIPYSNIKPNTLVDSLGVKIWMQSYFTLLNRVQKYKSEIRKIN